MLEQYAWVTGCGLVVLAKPGRSGSYRRDLIAMTALLPQGSRDHFDLDDILHAGLDGTSKESTGGEGGYG